VWDSHILLVAESGAFFYRSLCIIPRGHSNSRAPKWYYLAQSMKHNTLVSAVQQCCLWPGAALFGSSVKINGKCPSSGPAAPHCVARRAGIRYRVRTHRATPCECAVSRRSQSSEGRRLLYSIRPVPETMDSGRLTLAGAVLIDAHVHLFLHPGGGAEDLQSIEESGSATQPYTATLAASRTMLSRRLHLERGTWARKGLGSRRHSRTATPSPGLIPGPRSWRITANADHVVGGHEERFSTYNPEPHIFSNAT